MTDEPDSGQDSTQSKSPSSSADRSEATQRNGSDEELFAVEHRPERIPLHTNKKPMTNQKTLSLDEEIDDDELRSTRGTQRYCSECERWVRGNQRLEHPDHHHLGRTVAEANQSRRDDVAGIGEKWEPDEFEEDDDEPEEGRTESAGDSGEPVGNNNGTVSQVGNMYDVELSYSTTYRLTVGAYSEHQAIEQAEDELLCNRSPRYGDQVHERTTEGKTIFEDDDEAEKWDLTY